MTAKSEDKQTLQADLRLRYAYPYVRMHLEIRARTEGAPLLAPAVGLEPTTKRLTVARSTN